MDDQDRRGGSFTMGLIGTLLLGAGALWFLYLMGWISWVEVRPWDLWPLVLVVIGFRAVLNTGGLARVISIVMLAIGLALLGFNLGFFDRPWQHLQQFLDRHDLDPRLLWAGLLMLGGLFFLTGGSVIARRTRLPGNRVGQMAVFGGFELKPEDSDFQGGWIAAVFGGYDVDLRNCASTADEIRLDTVNLFGGGEIKVPRHWRVSVKGVPIFGGFSNETKFEARDDVAGPRLIINTITMFGGFSVEN